MYYIVYLICIHCHNYVTGDNYVTGENLSDLKDILEHCRSCASMARPDRLLFKYVCFACTYHSYNVGNFKTHVRTHTGDKPFECYACGYKSASPAGMSYHRRKTGH
ncbi:hypothetical protein M8J76_015250 [Diaphorina citri]|nr:hypothetical protein M8J76_015250 [Diaphorina citri]KAI5721214.1 hypothetical protein M8J77_017599 [Diaphorina citri]